MKKFLCLFILAVCGLTSQASAQDYFSSQYDESCCEMDWTGPYIGGNAGAFSHTAHRNDLDGFLLDNSGWTTIDTTVTAGVQLGYDWRCGNKLFGIVADWNWVDAENKLNNNPNISNNEFFKTELNWFTTIRGRAGLTVCNTLFYLTGGAVVADFDTSWVELPTEFRHRETRWGWTAGVGTEFLLSCNFSVGAEVLYLQFAHRERTFVDGQTFSTFANSDSAIVGRITVNYRFGDLFSGCCGY